MHILLKTRPWHGLIATLAAMLVIVACQNDPDPVPQAVPNTQVPQDAQATQAQTLPPPIVTQVVTRAPSRTPFPTTVPTISMQYVTYAGSWTMLLRYEITGSAIIDNIVYSSSIPIIIGSDGSIFGTGAFSPTFSSDRCAVQALNPDMLSFVVSGNLRPLGETIMADVIVTPSDVTVEEAYSATCLDPLNDTEFTDEIEVTLLWTVLTGADQLNFTFDMASFIHRVDIPAQDVSQLTSNQYDGQLIGEIYFGK